MRDYFTEQGPLATAAPACPIVKSLKGQTALVTGANSGIGRAIAAALGAAGAAGANYVTREDAAEETAEEVRHCGARAITVAADVSDESQVRDMFGGSASARCTTSSPGRATSTMPPRGASR